MHQAPFHQSTATNPCAHRQVDESLESLRRAPASLAQGRRVHVGIEGDRQVEGPPDLARQVHVLPARLGRGRNVPKAR